MHLLSRTLFRYYGYLYNKAFAAQLWQALFKAASPTKASPEEGREKLAGTPRSCLSRAAGLAVWEHLLMPGGSRDPKAMLKATLGGDQEPSLEPFFEALLGRANCLEP